LDFQKTKKKGIRAKVLGGLSWRLSVEVATQLLQIVFTAILARLLTRVDFGVVAMGMIFLRFVNMMASFGFGSAVIQAQKINNAQVSAVFYIHVGIGLLVSIISFIGAPWAADFFNEPKLTPVVQVLAWGLLLDSLAFPAVILRKNLQFAGYSILQGATLIISSLLGVFLAFSGFGLWSLVLRHLCHSLLYSFGIWPLAKWRPSRPTFKGTRQVFRFGTDMFFASTLAFFSTNLTGIIIGKYFGTANLGLYNIAYNLAMMPANHVKNVFTTVLMPAFASLKTDMDVLRDRFQRSLFLFSLVYVPAMTGLAAVALPFVVVVYGDKWSQAGVFLTILAVVAVLRGVGHILRSAINAMGRSRAILSIVIIELLVSVPLIALGGYLFDIMGAIWGTLAANLVVFGVVVYFTERSLQGRYTVLGALFKPALSAALMFSPVYLLAISLKSNLLYLGLEVGLGVIIYLVVIRLLLDETDKNRLRTLPFGGKIAALAKI